MTTKLSTTVALCLSHLRENGKIHSVKGFVSYAPCIHDVYAALQAEHNDDPAYKSKMPTLLDTPVSDMSLSDVYTYLTYLYREEARRDGFIKKNIKNGIFPALLARYQQLKNEQTA